MSQAHTASSAEIRIKRINIGTFFLWFLELEMLKNLSSDYRFQTFETVLGLYIRVPPPHHYIIVWDQSECGQIWAFR